MKITQHKYPICPICGDGYMKDDDKIRCACGNYYEEAKGGWEKYPTDKEVLQALSNVVINMVKQGNERYVIDTISETLKDSKKETAEAICRQIEDIELSYRNTSLEEWKAFKHIRNAIRDKHILNNKENL